MANTLKHGVWGFPRSLLSPHHQVPTMNGGAIVVLSPLAFRVCWSIIIFFHLFNACFAGIAAVAHLMLSTPRIYQNMWMLAIEQRLLVLSGWSYVVIASIQLAVVVRHIHHSIRAGELSFGYTAASLMVSPLASPHSEGWASSLRRTSSTLVAWTTVELKPRNDGVEILFQLRQLLEILMQTYQALQLSRSVARRDLNTFAVVVITLNCVHTPIIDGVLQRGFRLRQADAVRLLLLYSIDVLLDFVMTVVIPIAIMIPRFLEFDFSIQRFPVELSYNDVWATTAIGEGRQVLVTTVVDFISSMVPHLLGILSLAVIKSMLRRRVRIATRAQTLPMATDLVPAHPPSHHCADDARAPAFSTASRCTSRWTKSVLVLLHASALAWGVLVVWQHIRIQNHTISGDEIPGCKLEFNAWDAVKRPCAVLHLNCHTRGGWSGTSDELDSVLTLIERSVLRHVVFSHCPTLEIPRILVTEFSFLNAVSTFNCTIARWDTPLTRASSPIMAQLQLVDTNMTGIPDGLLHDALPQGLNLILHRSNLSVLPNDIGHVWSCITWSTLWLEHTLLQSLPPSFSRLRITKFSLGGSPISALADDFFDNKQLTLVRVSHTELAVLPSTMADVSHLTVFLADHTPLAAVPNWLLEWANTDTETSNQATMVGSPFCSTTRPTTKLDLCGDVMWSDRNELPYEVIAAQRPLLG